ncbi:MAG: OmpA family protein, partial [Pseudomonadota bacterium]
QESYNMKKISLISAIALMAAFAAPSLVSATEATAIVHDARNNQIKDSRGNCVRTIYGVKDEQCGGEVKVQKAHTKLASVYFDFNKSELNKKARVALDQLLVNLKNKKIGSVIIAGYADEIGSNSYNLQLSKKRAQSVKKYLNQRGFKNTDVDLRALGETKADSNCKGKTDGKLHACMQEERRVDIELNVTK